MLHWWRVTVSLHPHPLTLITRLYRSYLNVFQVFGMTWPGIKLSLPAAQPTVTRSRCHLPIVRLLVYSINAGVWKSEETVVWCELISPNSFYIMTHIWPSKEWVLYDLSKILDGLTSVVTSFLLRHFRRQLHRMARRLWPEPATKPCAFGTSFRRRRPLKSQRLSLICSHAFDNKQRTWNKRLTHSSAHWRLTFVWRASSQTR